TLVRGCGLSTITRSAMRRTFAQAAAGRQFVDDRRRCRPPEGSECHHLRMPRRALPVLLAVLISVGALAALAALGAGGSDGGASSAVSADGDGAPAASSSTTTSSTSTTTTTAPIPASD